jgi:hypothetical protein
LTKKPKRVGGLNHVEQYKTPTIKNATFVRVMGNLDMWKLIIMLRISTRGHSPPTA